MNTLSKIRNLIEKNALTPEESDFLSAYRKLCLKHEMVVDCDEDGNLGLFDITGLNLVDFTWS